MIDIHCRMVLLDAFNRSLEELLPIVNLRNTNSRSIGAVRVLSSSLLLLLLLLLRLLLSLYPLSLLL